MKQRLLVLSLPFLVGSCLAQTGSSEPQLLPAQQRQNIEKSRADEALRYAAETAACYQNFAVSDCLSQVKSRHHRTLGLLRRQELFLNAQERQKKGLEARQRIDEKAVLETEQEQFEKNLSAEQKHLDLQQRAGQRIKNSEKSASRAEEAVRAAQDRAQERDQKAADRERLEDQAWQKQKDFDEKLHRAQEHKTSVQKKMAEEKIKPVQPLPAGH